MTTPTTSNTRIAKNTLLLYVRMAVAMLVSLYTSRIVLQTLGVDDFGIWSVVGTLVIMVSFITSPLSAATQRFINVALGGNDESKAAKIFNQSLILNGLFAFAMIILLESFGFWFLTTKMEIPPERLHVAMRVYHIAVASFVISILKVPFDAVLIAHQRFGFFAIVSIFDIFLKLLIVLLLPFAHNHETLIFYAFLLFIVATIDFLIRAIYCVKKLAIYRIQVIWERLLVKELLSFTGWSTLGAFAQISGNQGLSIVLNLFFGVAANAAMGLANQVANAVNQFVYNFQLAFQPQIIQSHASANRQATFNLVCFASKVSFILIFAIGCPLMFNIDFVLSLWLGDVPEYTAQFCILVICIAIIESIGAPLWMVVQAVGKIRAYQITISSLLILSIIIGYILLSFGFPAPAILVGKLGVFTICLIYRLIAVRKLAHFSIKQMIKGFLIPEFAIALVSILPMMFIVNILSADPFLQLIVSTLICITALSILSWKFIINASQRETIKIKFKSKFKRK